MIYYLATREGGEFTECIFERSMKPSKVVSRLNSKCIIIFKCGMVWDGFLPRRGKLRSSWRHLYDGGRKEGKRIYKGLSSRYGRKRIYFGKALYHG